MDENEELYNLLPAVHRRRDEEEGRPLRALLGLMETELKAFEGDLENLYDNWFIETSDEWAVSYIGDLLGVGGLHPGNPEVYSQRAFIANTLALRRRKGTASALEQVARDATGWDARVVEFFQNLSSTQNMNHARLESGRTAAIRRSNPLELVDTPFDNLARTADVRKAQNGGKYNIPSLGIFLWQLQSYTMKGAVPRAQDPGCYSFNPLGLDAPLFNIPQTETDITQFAGEINLPVTLRRQALYEELEAIRVAVLKGETPQGVFFDVNNPVVEVFADGVKIPPEELLAGDLRDWTRPEASKTYTEYVENQGPPISVDPVDTIAPIKAMIDPVLGRLCFADGFDPADVRVNFAYGFSGDVGGGPYNRRETATAGIPESLNWDTNGFHAGVLKDPQPVGSERLYTTIGEALTNWTDWLANDAGDGQTVAIISVMDNSSYAEVLDFQVPEDALLYIIAADWPATTASITTAAERIPGRVVAEGLRPHINGDISITGSASANSKNPGRVSMDGLMIEGTVTVKSGNLSELRVSHSSILGPAAAISVETDTLTTTPGLDNENLKVSVFRALTREILFNESPASLFLCDSIVQGHGAIALQATMSVADIQGSTIFGTGELRTIEAGNSLFMETLTVERKQEGCVRYSYLTEGSVTPRRFRTQAELALAANNAAIADGEPGTTDQLVEAQVRPILISHEIADPCYGRLSRACPTEITEGGEDGAEMGAFFYLKQPQRESNLRVSLKEYLRFGREAGIFFVYPEKIDPEDT